MQHSSRSPFYAREFFTTAVKAAVLAGALAAVLGHVLLRALAGG